MSSQTTAANNGLKFSAGNTFQKDIRARVDRYFSMTGRSPRDCPQMYVKTAVLAVWFLGSYLGLILFATAWWNAIPLAISLGLAMAAIGFNIQHDGGHGAYSDKRWVNRLMAMTLDLLGGSSYLWAIKHNSLHHTYANIEGHDDDIDVGVFGRLSPHQRHRWFHRLQHVYLWFLYGLLAVKWQLVDDFLVYARGHIGNHRIQRPTGRDLVVFICGKIAFFSLAFVVPCLLHPIWAVIGIYLLASWVQGLVMSTVFQLAHVVEEAEFPEPDPDTGRMENAWAIHQVETTVNFARRNRVLSWFVGGLNFQIEHHLFPRICHIHYPKISRIVERACERAGVEYSSHETVASSVRSHYRWLRTMGKPGPMAT